MHKPLSRMAPILTLAALLCAPVESKLRPGHIPGDKQETLDPNVINDTQLDQTIGPNSKGSAVVRAQILLDRAHFSCGQIDGEYGDNLQKTVVAFQHNRDLPAEEGVGPGTWGALNADSAPALATYTIAQQDVAGPFGPVPADLMKQATLQYLGFESPLAGLAEKFHSSPQLVQALNPGKKFDQSGEQILVPNVITMPPGQAASVVVSKSDRSVSAYDA